MGEKKSIKVSLKTYLITMFLMLLIIGILLGYIMHTSKTIQAKLNTIDEYIQSQKTVEIVEEVEENEEQEENVVTEEVEENVEETNTVEDTTEVEEKEFTEEEIEKALNGYLNIFVGRGSPESVLNCLDLMSYFEAERYTADEENYKLTEIPYTLFEEYIQKYTTLENFQKIEGNKFVEDEFKNVDGKVAYFDGGWSGIEYEVHKIIKNENTLEFTYSAEILRTEGERKVVENIEFSIEEKNGKCVISNCSI